MGNFNEATGLHLRCPFCRTTNEHISRRGAEWFCETCHEKWFAYTEHDKLELKLNRIANDEDPE